MGRLRRVSSEAAGISRRRRGRGFGYLDERGRRLADEEALERIRGLAIPPAWEDVWICTDPQGHLQAVGTDAAGRRQYLYHPRWSAGRDRAKFDRMLRFAHALPRMRKQVDVALEGEEPSGERVLAGAVRMLDRGLFRIGGEEYEDRKGSFGLATLERRHVHLPGDGMIAFEYAGKTGEELEHAVVDPEVERLARQLKRRRGGGDGFLAYKDGARWTDVRSDEINAFVKELIGPEFSAKDFRTWHATVLAAVALAAVPRPDTPTGRKRVATHAVREVAHHLRNTPAVCRRSYIDPRVFDRYDAAATMARTLERLAWAELPDVPATHGPVERAVLRLIETGG